MVLVRPHHAQGTGGGEHVQGWVGKESGIVQKGAHMHAQLQPQSMSSAGRLSSASNDKSVDPFDTTQEIDPATNDSLNNGDDHELVQTHVLSSGGIPSIASCASASGGKQHRRSMGGGGKQRSSSTKTRTIADLRAARESRANEALRMKDEQLRILQGQNNQLLSNLDRLVGSCTS